VDNWRWAGVPFYTRRQVSAQAGERNREPFKSAPLSVFRNFGEMGETIPNILILATSGKKGISLKFDSKRPAAGMKICGLSFDGFKLPVRVSRSGSPSATKTLLP